MRSFSTLLLWLACFAACYSAFPHVISGLEAVPSFNTIHHQEDTAPSPVDSEPLEQLTSTVLPALPRLQADIVLPCQGCGSERADVYPAFQFTLFSSSDSDCSVVFSLNQSVVHLAKDQSSKSAAITAEDNSQYHLQTDLSCGDQSGPTYTSLLSVSIASYNQNTIREQSGFTVAVDIQGSVSALTLFQDVHAGDLISWASVDIPTLEPSTADAIKLTLQAEATRQSLKDKSDASIEVSVNQPESETSSEFVNSCSLSHFRQATHCAIRTFSEKVSSALDSAIIHLEQTLGEARTEDYRNRLQTAMTSVKAKYDCEKKEEVSPVVVTVTEVSSQDEHIEQKKPTTKKVKFAETQSPLVKALEILAAALGLGGLLAFIKARCCSLRRRVERLADREERHKAREYRRAARQEAWRRRWAGLRKACCFGAPDVELEDEEKRALVACAARDGRCDGGVDATMAELNGLYYAREIVSGMIRTRHMTAEQVDLEAGPAVIVHAYHAQSQTSRSRASSLPSYNSEMLPDYSSQPESDIAPAGDRVANGMRRSVSPISSTGSSRFTPESSIPDISRRPSTETLRTQSSR